ncbi:MAG TPA: contact-dependent growth inhibition system immunity protein [Streptomyces sp.]
MLSSFFDRKKTVEELEGEVWPDPPAETTSLVRGVHELRKRPIDSLSVDNLRRLIGQDIGLRWLLPVALDFLRETAPEEAATGWYDDDLLSAVLSREEAVWRAKPDLARHINETVSMLTDPSEYIQRKIDFFRSSLADLL